jgi:hypothetical protein
MAERSRFSHHGSAAFNPSALTERESIMPNSNKIKETLRENYPGQTDNLVGHVEPPVRFPEEWNLRVADDGWQYVSNVDTNKRIGDPCHISDCRLTDLVEAHNKAVQDLSFELLEEYPEP